MIWEQHAARLANAVTHPFSRWRPAVASTPRHLFIPRWWEVDDAEWVLREPMDEGEWFGATYRDRSMITRVGPWHADLSRTGDRPVGRPTSSATLPSLVIKLYRHALLDGKEEVLDIGTGSGYGTALVSRRLSPQQVTSVDVDPYLVEAARERLDTIGLRPTVEAVDATRALPGGDGKFDRIVATVAVRTVPETWLNALCVGGRLVTTLAGTSLLITAEKDESGGATGRVEWDRAGFMHARHGEDYPPALSVLLAAAHDQDGDNVTTGPYPVVDVANAWDLDSMLNIMAPGIEHRYHDDSERRVAVMAHADGSWARATAAGNDRPTVHQGGPRRLWDLLDEARSYWLEHGELPVRGARVIIKPDGQTILARGKWHAKID